MYDSSPFSRFPPLFLSPSPSLTYAFAVGATVPELKVFPAAVPDVVSHDHAVGREVPQTHALFGRVSDDHVADYHAGDGRLHTVDLLWVARACNPPSQQIPSVSPPGSKKRAFFMWGGVKMGSKLDAIGSFSNECDVGMSAAGCFFYYRPDRCSLLVVPFCLTCAAVAMSKIYVSTKQKAPPIENGKSSKQNIRVTGGRTV